MRKVVPKMTIALAIVIPLLIGCSPNEVNNRENPYLEVVPLPDDALVYIGEGSFGYWLGVAPLEFEWDWYEELWNGYLELNSPTNPLIAHISNVSREGSYFVLKMFLNYEEVSFRPLAAAEFETQFTFFLEGGYQADFPFVLDLSTADLEGTSKLTAAVFVDPDRHAISGDHRWSGFGDASGMVLNYDLFSGTREDIVLDVPYTQAAEHREAVTFNTIQINTQFGDFQTKEFIHSAEHSLQVRRGKTLELAFFASPFVTDVYELESYIILALLDWQQIPINGQPFLYIHVKDHDFEHVMEHGVLTIEVPDEVGVYDFIAMIIPNPTRRNSFGNYRPMDLSDRFTIEVVE